jgi:signal transduction histidine kinase/DNA-binding LacI/PurR family transcriptional regulator/AraC-like DNA-binding protein
VKKTRKTIAFLGSTPGGARNHDKWQLWRGIAEVARENDLNVIYVAGEDIDESPQAKLYTLLEPDHLDGLIVWNTFVTQHRNNQQIQEFYDRFVNLPIVSIEKKLERFSCISVDYARGIHEIINHLVQFHGFRHIAYIPDHTNPLSDEQQSEFIHTLTQYGFFDPRLIGQLENLDAQGLIPGEDYQAVVAGSDNTAAEVITSLQRHNIRIPEDLAVTGFYDGQQARGLIPPLTTIRIPFRKMGRQAVSMLMKTIREGEQSESIQVPIKIITRRSCGCFDQTAEKVSVGYLPKSPYPIETYIQQERELIIDEMAIGLGSSAESYSSQWASSVFDGATTELLEQRQGYSKSPTKKFLDILNRVLIETVREDINPNRWHESISTLRRHLWPHLHGTSLAFCEDMFQQARVLIGQTAGRAEVHRHWQAARHVEILNNINAALLTTFEIDQLTDILAGSLPKLGITSCILAMYEEPEAPEKSIRVVMEVRYGKRYETFPDRIFSTRELVRNQHEKVDIRKNLLLIDLFFVNEQIGFVIFEAEPPEIALQSNVFIELQTQLSSALKGISLRQELQEAKKKADEAILLQSRFLSIVSHELRTPLNLIVGLSEMAMREQARGVTASNEVLRKYQEQIHTSGQHLDRLIRDVLDLASSQTGQMELIFTVIDLIPILRESADMGKQLAEQKQLDFIIDIPEELPRVKGDRTRLRQVLLNLISNAVKFTAYGTVGLSATTDKDNIIISVWDTGLGIDKDEQEKIFNEFYQSERRTQRGYGGMGLGLAITRLLVEKHGGKISVASSGKENTGSKFTFSLPFLKEEIPQPRLKANLNKVFILSKEQGSGQSLSQRLSEIGFRSEVIFLGEDFSLPQSLLQYPSEAIILDIEPASEKGWEVMKLLKENPITQDVPVLFYSLLEEEGLGSVIELEFLSKPLGANDIILTLQKHGFEIITSSRSSKILLIDDEPGILELHTTLLKEALPKSRIYTAMNGIEGLALMRKIHPDLILLDLVMPEMDGFEVLQHIQMEEALRNIPVIILSAQSLSKHDITRLGRSVTSVLEKGLFTAEETISRIDEALSRRKKMSSETHRLVRQAMAFIHDHFNESISRSEIAKQLCINEQYLTRCFNKELGISPIAYLNRYRILQAKKLLKMGHLSITEIALKCGYSSQSYFSRAFQRETGNSPSEYQTGQKRPSL